MVRFDGPVDTVVPELARHATRWCARGSATRCGIRVLIGSRCASAQRRRAHRRDHRRRPGNQSRRPASGLENLTRAREWEGEFSVTGLSGRGTPLLWKVPLVEAQAGVGAAGRRRQESRCGAWSPAPPPGCGVDVELGQDARHIVLDRLLRQEHPLGDLPVGQALADQVEDLALVVGEFGERIGGVVLPSRRRARSAARAAVVEQRAARGRRCAPRRPGCGRGSA